MFHKITPEIETQMNRLERIDKRDREDGTPRMMRLRQIPPETGRFLAFIAVTAPPGEIVEIGTSAGYSTLWLSLAALERDRTITTFELSPEKVVLAKQTLAAAEVEDRVNQVQGDARDYLPDIADIGFCFLDTEKEIYDDCYEAVVPNLVPGGILVADNAESHRRTLTPFINRVMTDHRVDALIAGIGKGLLICRKVVAQRNDK
jgi:predicted O-methyltransferase YrrM